MCARICVYHIYIHVITNLHYQHLFPGNDSQIMMSQSSELGKQLIKAIAERKDVAVLADLVRRGAALDIQDENGVTPLSLATRMCPIDFCQVLFYRGALEGNHNALLSVASSGRVDLCGLLVGRGASITVQDIHGQTCLHHSSRNGHFDVCRLLLEVGIDSTIKDTRGKTALDLARAARHTYIITLLECHRPAFDTVVEIGSKKRKFDCTNESLDERAAFTEGKSRKDADDELIGLRDRCVAAEKQASDISALLEATRERLAEAIEREERERVRALKAENLIEELRERAARAEAKFSRDCSRDIVVKEEVTE